MVNEEIRYAIVYIINTTFLFFLIACAFYITTPQNLKLPFGRKQSFYHLGSTHHHSPCPKLVYILPNPDIRRTFDINA